MQALLFLHALHDQFRHKAAPSPTENSYWNSFSAGTLAQIHFLMNMEKIHVTAAKNGAKSAKGVSSKKPWMQPVKPQVKTVMPDGLKIQVHQRQTPPASYRICNGTTFELYQPKTWGR